MVLKLAQIVCLHPPSVTDGVSQTLHLKGLSTKHYVKVSTKINFSLNPFRHHSFVGCSASSVPMHYLRDPLLSNLAYKRAFSRYGRKMVLASASHTHSSLQFVPLVMIRKVQTWFFKVQNYSETSDCLFLQAPEVFSINLLSSLWFF